MAAQTRRWACFAGCNFLFRVGIPQIKAYVCHYELVALHFLTGRGDSDGVGLFDPGKDIHAPLLQALFGRCVPARCNSLQGVMGGGWGRLVYLGSVLVGGCIVTQ